ncbi:uncharacterized protein LOC143997960 [Lithobates pipiens]
MHRQLLLSKTQQAEWITYRVLDTPLSDGKIYPTLFHIVPGDRVRYAAIFKLFQHFGWNWVGIFSSDDGSGDEESQELSNMMSQHGICTEYIIPLIGDIENDIQKLKIVRESTAKVVIVCGPYTHELHRFANRMQCVIGTITFIFPPSWSKISSQYLGDCRLINCSFIFLWPPKCNLARSTYYYSNFPKRLHDPILEDISIFNFRCASTNIHKNDVFKMIIDPIFTHCNSTDWSYILNMHTNIPSSAYMAEYLLGRALHNMYMMTNKYKLHGFQHKEAQRNFCTVARYESRHFRYKTGLASKIPCPAILSLAIFQNVENVQAILSNLQPYSKT